MSTKREGILDCKQQVFDNFNFLQQALEFDPDSCQISAANSDWLIFRGKMLRGFIAAINAKLGAHAKIVIEEAAYTVGANFAQDLLDKGLNIQEVPTIIEVLFNQAGWGKAVTQVDKDTKTITISIENCATARDTKTAEPNCHFLKGYIRGIYEKSYSAKYQSREIACMANKGNTCVFQLNPKP